MQLIFLLLSAEGHLVYNIYEVNGCSPGCKISNSIQLVIHMLNMYKVCLCWKVKFRFFYYSSFKLCQSYLEENNAIYSVLLHLHIAFSSMLTYWSSFLDEDVNKRTSSLPRSLGRRKYNAVDKFRSATLPRKKPVRSMCLFLFC